MRSVLVWIALAFMAYTAVVLLCGCAAHSPPPPNSIPAVGSSIDKGKAHVDTAEALVQKAKPESSKTGKALLDVASDEHKKADTELDRAKGELAQVQKERDSLIQKGNALEDTVKARDKELASVKSGWGYKLQQFVTHLFVIFAVLIGVHFLAGVLSLVPAFAPAAGVLAIVGRVCNPVAWFQAVVDHVHFKRMCPCEDVEKAGSAVVQIINPAPVSPQVPV